MIGDAIRRERERQGLSPRQLAVVSGVSHQTIRDAEAGKRSPMYATLQKIAAGLGVTVRGLDTPARSAKKGVAMKQ